MNCDEVDAAQALHQDAHARVGVLQHLEDAAGGAADEQPSCGFGLLVLRPLLRHQRQHAVAGQRLLDDLQRRAARDEQRDDGGRKHHHAAQRQHRQLLRDGDAAQVFLEAEDAVLGADLLFFLFTHVVGIPIGDPRTMTGRAGARRGTCTVSRPWRRWARDALPVAVGGQGDHALERAVVDLQPQRLAPPRARRSGGCRRCAAGRARRLTWRSACRRRAARRRRRCRRRRETRRCWAASCAAGRSAGTRGSRATRSTKSSSGSPDSGRSVPGRVGSAGHRA